MDIKKCRGGFSLIELLIVMVLVSLVAGIAMPRFFGSVDKAKLRSASATLASGLRGGRTKAVSEKQMYSMVVDAEKRIVYPVKGPYFPDSDEEQKPDGTTVELPEGIQLWDDNGKIEKSVVEFYPSGGASGGRFIITGSDAKDVEDGTAYEVSIDLLSGRTRMALLETDKP